MRFALKQRSVLPGFGLGMGFSMLYLSLLVLLPISTIFLKTSTLSWEKFFATITAPRVLASYQLTFGAAITAALLNASLGLILAWVLVRYRFPGRRLIDGLVDLPFALPTAVGGIALTATFASTGWIGQYLDAIGVKAAFSPLGVIIALTYVGLPFVVRTVQPILEDFDPEIEEAAATLGANHWQILRRVILPTLLPAVFTGFALAFARALGEYGSVVFISGNMPMRTEITSLLIVTKLEQFDHASATAIASVTLVASFATLLSINLGHRLISRRYGAA